MRWTLLALVAGCGVADSAACDWAENRGSCDECYDGEMTCTLDGQTVTAGTCGDCQALHALSVALCDAGSEVSEEQIENADCELERATPTNR
ncbi:MAG: hypothetical protein H6735_15285 [Alphaproteobacteria bacterium]|nr:hypothetical protein [Alphaproteobacteria bacterium]